MDAHEISEAISEHAHEDHHESAGEGFRKRTAVAVGVMGMLLAIASLGGEYFMKETINANILASDAYGYYQARNVRQTSYQLAAEQLEDFLATQPNLSAEARAAIEKRIATHRATVKRYESDPKNGTGKAELLAKAQGFEHERDEAQAKDLNFDFSRALYEIAVVLGSVSIVAASRQLLWLAGSLAVVATLLSINGFFSLVEVPLHLH